MLHLALGLICLKTAGFELVKVILGAMDWGVMLSHFHRILRSSYQDSGAKKLELRPLLFLAVACFNELAARRESYTGSGPLDRRSTVIRRPTSSEQRKVTYLPRVLRRNQSFK